MKKVIPIIFLLTACNSMHIVPGSVDPDAPFYSTAGGFSMKRSIKERMEDRGYNVFIGKQVTSRKVGTSDGGEIELNEYKMEDVRYVINVNERRERFMPFWCFFNGFWFWNFNVSIGDQQTGKEIFTWRGRGCADSSLVNLDRALDELEAKDINAGNKDVWFKQIKENKPG